MGMAKQFDEKVLELDFSETDRFEKQYPIVQKNGREQFIFDLSRGNLNRARLKFQTRARKIITLARIDINSKAHRNPIGSPHRPNYRFTETHVHLYNEQFGDRIAYLPSDLKGFEIPANKDDGAAWMISFLRYCNVVSIPRVQVTN